MGGKKREITLKEMVKYAKRKRISIDPILDMWNKDKKFLIKSYIEIIGRETVSKMKKSGELDAIFGTPSEMVGKKDIETTKRVLSALKYTSTYSRKNDELTVVITVFSEFSKHKEKEVLMFDKGVSDDSDEVQDTLLVSISCLCYDYLISM